MNVALVSTLVKYYVITSIITVLKLCLYLEREAEAVRDYFKTREFPETELPQKNS